MITKAFQNLQLSALGFGAMRLPVIGEKISNIDQTATEMVDYAMKNGVNYYDTAWGYHEGMSEISIGKTLGKYPRNSFYLATKFPGYDLANMNKVEEIFEKQLEKCGVEYFDFYLFHNVCETNIEGYLNPEYGIFDYLMKQKKNGRIKHLGFSAHASLETMQRFLDAYGEHMEFCQIQLNYMDWKFQNAKEKVELLKKYNIPIWVMEPVRGGKLATLPEEDEKELKALRAEESIPAWAFRFLQSIPGITMVLSGISNMAQLQENIKTYEEEKPLNQEEMYTLLGIADRMIQRTSLPCTECRYCTSKCPKQLDIPKLISLYNEHRSTETGFIAPMALAAVEQEKQPSACIGCRSCETVCPQQINISSAMADFAKRLQP